MNSILRRCDNIDNGTEQKVGGGMMNRSGRGWGWFRKKAKLFQYLCMPLEPIRALVNECHVCVDGWIAVYMIDRIR